MRAPFATGRWRGCEPEFRRYSGTKEALRLRAAAAAHGLSANYWLHALCEAERTREGCHSAFAEEP